MDPRPGLSQDSGERDRHDTQGLYFMDPDGKDRLALVGLEEDTGLFFPDDLGLYVKPGSERRALQLVTDR